MDSLDKIITVQISCKVPMNLWDKVKDIARSKGTTATDLTIKALHGMIDHQYQEEFLDQVKLGERVSVVYKNKEFLLHMVTKKDGVRGIFVRQPGRIFIPLSECKDMMKGDSDAGF